MINIYIYFTYSLLIININITAIRREMLIYLIVIIVIKFYDISQYEKISDDYLYLLY